MAMITVSSVSPISMSSMWSWNRYRSCWSRVRGSNFLNDSIESIDVISGVVYNSYGAIGFHDGVGTFNDSPISNFVLGFVITGYSISDAIVVLIFGMSLKNVLVKNIRIFINSADEKEKIKLLSLQNCKLGFV